MVNSVGIQNSDVSIKTVSEPTEVNFQPIPTFGGSISVTETAFDDHQGSLTLRNTLSFSDDHLWFLMTTRFLMPHRLYTDGDSEDLGDYELKFHVEYYNKKYIH